MNVPEKGFWRRDKSVVGKVSYPKKEKNIKYHVSDESRKKPQASFTGYSRWIEWDKTGRGTRGK